MFYFDRRALESHTGYASGAMQDAGERMTASVWDAEVEYLDKAIASWMHRWCNVPTFGSHYVTEYHDGRGDTWDDGQYTDEDKTFLLRDYATGAPRVYVDQSSQFEPASWVERIARSTATAGEFLYTTDGDTGVITFTRMVPTKGIQNVKVEYWAGYPDDDPEMEQIRMIAIRIAMNYLAYRKKIQESTTIRAAGVKDYAQMFDMEKSSKVFTREIEMMLCKYRRYVFGTGCYR